MNVQQKKKIKEIKTKRKSLNNKTKKNIYLKESANKTKVLTTIIQYIIQWE